MPEFRLTRATSREQIEWWARDFERECVVAMGTCWWSLYELQWMPYAKNGLPCDPRSSMLTQGSLAEFWAAALASPEHYGRHGIDALVAAFHGNLEVLSADGRGWRPTSLETWDRYNDLLDEAPPA